MFTAINIYPKNNKTDHISEKYIFVIEKKAKNVDIFSILGRIWSRIQIKIKRILQVFTVRLCFTILWSWNS